MPANAGALTAALAELGARLEGPADLPIAGFETIDTARAGDLTFIRSPEYASKWHSSEASAAVVTEGVDVPGHDPETRALIFVAAADLAVIKLLQHLAAAAPSEPKPDGIHPQACVHETATVDPTAAIGPCAVVGPGATIGAHTVIHAGAVIGAGVPLGEHCTIHPNASIAPGTTIGSHTVIFHNAAIGAEGFGFATNPVDGTPLRIPHAAGVFIGDHVEVGAGTTIDRGKLKDTRVGHHTKLDNLVQVGHTCQIGDRVRICASTAIGGSTNIGDDVIIGGACAFPDNINIAPGAIVVGGAMASGDVGAEEPWAGIPARPLTVSKRGLVAALQMAKFKDRTVARFKKLEQRVADLEPND